MVSSTKKGNIVEVRATTDEWASLCFFAAQAISCKELAGGKNPVLFSEIAWRAQAAKAMRVVERAARTN